MKRDVLGSPLRYIKPRAIGTSQKPTPVPAYDR
jgi:hypothetical protein